jgi:GT2 family glycosyltransferase
MKSFPSVSIIFPNYNGNKVSLTRLLQSIQKMVYPKQKITVTLVDNGSTDDSVLFIKKRFPWVNIIKLGKNNGFAKAVNKGIKTSKEEYLFITNNDVVLEKNCLKNLIEYLLTHPQIGIIGGKTYCMNPSDKVLYSAYKYNFYTGLFTMAKDANKIQEADWIPGAGMCCGRPLWEKLGGFDEDFFFTGEDLDFCLRAKRAGYKILYYPKAILWHSDGLTINLPEFSYFKHYESYKSKFRLILKHAGILQISLAFTLQFLIYLPYRTLMLREKIAIPLLRAFLWNMKNLKQTLRARKINYELS